MLAYFSLLAKGEKYIEIEVGGGATITVRSNYVGPP
jgi:hypothetical protein